MSTVEVVRERFRVALLDHERSVLLNILAAELERMTLGELGEVLTSDLGKAVRELNALALLDVVVARQRNTQPVPTVHVVDIPPPESQPADDSSRRRANGRVGSAEEIAEDVQKLFARSSRLMSVREIRAQIRYPEAKLVQVLRTLVADGKLVCQGSGRDVQYAFVSSRSSTPASESAVPTDQCNTSQEPPPGESAKVLEPEDKITVVPPSSGSPEALADGIRTRLTTEGTMSRPEIRIACRCSEEMLEEALNILRSEGVLKRSGHGRGTRYSVVSMTPPSSEAMSSSGVIRRRRGELPSRDES